jgi:hypothetical protein
MFGMNRQSRFEYLSQVKVLRILLSKNTAPINVLGGFLFKINLEAIKPVPFEDAVDEKRAECMACL